MNPKNETASSGRSSRSEGMAVSASRRRLAKVVTVSFSVLGLLYLMLIPLGVLDSRERLGAVEALIFGIILLFNSGLVERLEKFAISDKGFEFQLEQIQARQIQQQLEIKTLEFLMRRFVTDAELGHLWGLVNDKPFPYKKSSFFESELRHLRAGGLIEGKPGVSVGGLPEKGDLKDFFFITESGRVYLDYRSQLEKLGENA